MATLIIFFCWLLSSYCNLYEKERIQEAVIAAHGVFDADKLLKLIEQGGRFRN